MSKKEEVVNIPLPPDVKAALRKRAHANGRAMIREGAKLITDGVKKGARK